MKRTNAQKDALMSAMEYGNGILYRLAKAVEARGGTRALGLMYDRLGEKSPLFTQFADLIIGPVEIVLKHLVLSGTMLVSPEAFIKSSFFTNDWGKIHLYSTFRGLVLPEIPDTIPEFREVISRYFLTKHMYDSDIQAELGNPKPFTVGEFGAVIRDLISIQPNGPGGMFLSNDRANVFYVKLANNAVVVVSVNWYRGARGWVFSAFVLGGSQWEGGTCVFSRS